MAIRFELRDVISAVHEFERADYAVSKTCLDGTPSDLEQALNDRLFKCRHLVRVILNYAEDTTNPDAVSPAETARVLPT